MSVWVVAALWLAPLAQAGEAVTLPLVAHVAPDTPAAFVAEQLARANEIYAPYGVSFVVDKTVELPGQHAALETRADRDALGAYVQRGAIDWFVVRSLRDVDDPSQMRRGVHWRSETHPGARYVIVSSIAGASTLAHELGHYLGNHKHSETPGNLMSYLPGEGLPVLDDKQQKRLAFTLRDCFKSGELRKLSAHARDRQAH